MGACGARLGHAQGSRIPLRAPCRPPFPPSHSRCLRRSRGPHTRPCPQHASLAPALSPLTLSPRTPSPPHPPHPVTPLQSITPIALQAPAAFTQTPAWRRARTRGAAPSPASLTLVHSHAKVPNPRAGAASGRLWMPNQHDSDTLRPADVTVYVSGQGGEALDALEAHLRVQETETLHAVIVVGPLCSDSSWLRWAG